MISIDLLTLAKKIDNYEIDATGGTARWTTDKIYKNVVPAGKRWFVMGGVVNRDVASTFTVRIYNSGDKIVQHLDTQSAATGLSSWPSNVASAAVDAGAWPKPLDAGDYVQVTFATSQTAGAYASCVVLEVDV